MCGIAGFWTGVRLDRPNHDVLRAMTDALRHRGPDDAGHCCDDDAGVALGHRRLSIIDVSAEGHQPMASVSGRYVVVFNGEIYNYREISANLTAAGARFRGHSDTEVMLEAIERWGLHKAVESLAGMFAMAVWDRESRELHLIRDRIGEKPLYYARLRNGLVFGSELKALRVHPLWEGVIDRGALALYLRHNYVPAPYSIFESVYKLEPGTILTFRRPERAAEPARTEYWSANQAATRGMLEPFDLAEPDLIDACEDRLRQSIGQQMISDVPLGAFLSGGIDSSLIVALMQTLSERPVQTFTIGFDLPEYDESAHARAVARHLGTDHTELRVRPQESLDVIPRLPALYDEPFADSSQIPTFLVAQLARTKVTVSLSGDGGDELFGGYYRYFLGQKTWRMLRPMPRPVRTGLAAALRFVSPDAWNALFSGLGAAIPAARRVTHAGDKMHKLASILKARTGEQMYRTLVSQWDDPVRVALGALEPPTNLTRPYAWPADGDLVPRMMFLDLVSYLPDDIMVKVDRATMGVSLESRAPFLDHRVVEFAWRVPMRYKVRDGKGKWLLRRILERHVPPSITDRPKMGFGVPVDHWLRSELRPWAEELLAPRRLKQEGNFDSAIIAERWRQHQSGEQNWHSQLWTILMFQAWRESVLTDRARPE